MEFTSSVAALPEACSGFSLVLVERLLREADSLGLPADWANLSLGHPSGRVTAYRSPQRVTALLAGLAAGLQGIAPGNTWLRPNAALQARLGGRFPDQGTIHRWLDQATPDQAGAFRDHLHRVVRTHGRWWEVLATSRRLLVDIDGQGLVARGQRFERAAAGYLGDGIDRGYQRYVCYAAATREVLDEFLAPGNCTLMSQLPAVLAGLDAVFTRAQRDRVLLRMDAHGGTIGNLRTVKAHGYHYLCPLQSWSAVKRLREQVQGRRGTWFTEADSAGREHRVQFWVLRRWKLSGKGRGRQVYTRATVYHERHADGKKEWKVLVSDQKHAKGKRLWQCYHERGGTIEEYNDQAERAYHLEVMRTGCFAGLQVLHSLVALTWNLTQWATASWRLPPVQAPQAAPERWVAVWGMDLTELQRRAAQSGLRLYRERPGAVLEVEDSAGTPESAAWRAWLQQPIQLRLRWTG
jgi:Transposase DDE domain group 1